VVFVIIVQSDVYNAKYMMMKKEILF